MEWDLCSSGPWVPFYPYTMFQNPMSKPSSQKSRKNHHNSEMLVTQSSNIVHCTPTNLYVQIFKSFLNTFSLLKMTFFFYFCHGQLGKQPKISHFVDFDWEKKLKFLEWHVYRVWGMPNPMVLVLRDFEQFYLVKTSLCIFKEQIWLSNRKCYQKI